MASQRKHINELIELLSADPPPANLDIVEKKENELEQDYDDKNLEPNNELYTALIESNSLGVTNEKEKALKTLTVSLEEHIQLLKILPTIRNTEKIQKIIIKKNSVKVQDDIFSSLLRCKNLSLEEIEIGCQINQSAFKDFIENKQTINLKVLTIKCSNFSKDEFIAIITTIIEYSYQFPNLTKLILFSLSSIKVPLEDLFIKFGERLRIELTIQWKAKTTELDFKDLYGKIPNIPLEISIKQRYYEKDLFVDNQDFKKLIDQIDVHFLKNINLEYMKWGDYFQYFNRPNLHLKALHYCEMTGEGDFVKFLNSDTCTDLEVLDFSKLDAKTDSPKWLICLSTKLPKLQEINLEGAKYFSNTDWIEFSKVENLNLKKLNLDRSSNITTEVIEKICKSFINLESLSVNETHLKDESLKHLEKLNNLVELFIDSNEFSADLFKVFLGSPVLKSLKKISLCDIGIDKNIIIEGFLDVQTDLKTINGNFDISQLQKIVKCKYLKNLSLHNSLPIYSSSFGNSHLEALLTKNPEEGVEINYLKKLYFIKKVDDKDKITEATLIKLVSSENLNPVFNMNEFLKLVSENVTADVLEKLANNEAFMKYLYKLDVKKFKNAAKGIEAIFQSKHISPLFDWYYFLQGIAQNPGLEEKVLKCLENEKLANLYKIDLTNFDFKKLNDDQLSKFFSRKFPNLKDLNLSHTNLDEKIIEKLFYSDDSKKVLNSLMILTLNENTDITEEGFDNLWDTFNSNTELLGLELDKCQITNDNLKKLTTSNLSKKLQYLSIKDCKMIDYEGLETLINLHKDNTKFKIMNIYRDYKDSLCIDQNNQKISVFLKVEDVFKIQRIFVNNDDPEEDQENYLNELKEKRSNVSDLVLKKFLDEEKRIANFTKLDFSDCPIHSKGLGDIAKCKFLKNLQSLSLKNTKIDNEGIKFLTESKKFKLKNLEIEGCKKITRLSLEHILNCKNFHHEFNPEKILENYAYLIDEGILLDLEKSDYKKNIKVIYFKTKNKKKKKEEEDEEEKEEKEELEEEEYEGEEKNSSEKFKCLKKLIELENKNLLIKIEKLTELMSDIKDEITDDFLEKFVKSRIFSELHSLDLNTNITVKGLTTVIEANNLNKKFDIQSFISKNLHLMSDCILASLSKSTCFSKFQYTSELLSVNKKANEEKTLGDKNKIDFSTIVKEVLKVSSKEDEKNKDLDTQKEQETEIENKITSAGLWYLSLSSNENFKIQDLINDFGEMITSLFIKNMVQQSYFRKICKQQKEDKNKKQKGEKKIKSISFLNLINCTELKEDDLCVIIKSSHPDFDLEKFIKIENLPNNNINLVTNDVIKATAKSAFIKKNYNKENIAIDFNNPDSFKRFDFDVSKYPKVDYAINDLIQAHASQIRHYSLYLQNYTAYLSPESLRIMRDDIKNYHIFNLTMKNKHKTKDEYRKDKSAIYKDEEEIFNKLSTIKVLKFSQNKFIYDPSFKMSLTSAFVNFQNQNDLNLNNKTVNYYVKEIAIIQEKNSSPDLYDKDHEVLLDLIKMCKNLEELNLDNVNLGDDFIKHLTIYLSENPEHLNKLEIFEIKNNYRITSVGLKYLYCSIIDRCNVLKTINVDEEESLLMNKDYDADSFTTFVNNGLKGMINNKLDQTRKDLNKIYLKCLDNVTNPKKGELNLTYDEKDEDQEEGEFLYYEESKTPNRNVRKKSENNKVSPNDGIPGAENSKVNVNNISCLSRFVVKIKFLMHTKTLKILGMFCLFSPILLFHYFERFLFTVPKYMNYCISWMDEKTPFQVCVKPFRLCWGTIVEKFYDCFGNCFHVGRERQRQKTFLKNKLKENNNEKSFQKKNKDQKSNIPEDEENLYQANEDDPIEELKENKKNDDNESIIKLSQKHENDKEKNLEDNNEMKINVEKKEVLHTENEEAIVQKEKEVLKTEFPKQNKQNDRSFKSLYCSFWSCIRIKKEDENKDKGELIERYKKCKEEIQKVINSKNSIEDQHDEGNQEDIIKEKEKIHSSLTAKNLKTAKPNDLKNIQSPLQIKKEKILNQESIQSPMQSKKKILPDLENIQSPTQIKEEKMPDHEKNESQKKKDFDDINYSSYFYYDESLITVNNILFGQSLSYKTNVNNPNFEGNPDNEKDLTELPYSSAPLLSNNLNKNKIKQQNVYNPFLIVSKMKWVILLDFIIFYILVIFYLLYLKLIMYENATLFNQIPYFVYIFCSFILESSLCWEVTSIINNVELTSMRDSTILSNLITSQTAKYDTFTNLSFALVNLQYNGKTRSFEYNEIFIPAVIFVGFNIILNFKNFLAFFWKSFISKKYFQSNYHSSKYINKFSRLCLQFDFQSLGRLLDRFSTNSAKKYNYWFLPKTLKNIYIPTIITTTFARLIFEDIPLLIIQLYILISKSIFDFTNIASLVSTILALFMTLHTTWNVKPSTFGKNLFMRFFTQTKNVRESWQKEKMDKETKKQEKIKAEREELTKKKIKDIEAETLEKRWDEDEAKENLSEIQNILNKKKEKEQNQGQKNNEKIDQEHIKQSKKK